MQIFELHFNPKNKEGRSIDTFCYQPEDVYEKRLGALAIAGELTRGSSNKTLLNNLASKVKGVYHSLPTRTQEEALREGLKKGNEFLNNETWKGDLNLAILSIKSDELQFSKIGNLKILLSRNGEITDIGKNAEDNTDNFGSIVTGKIKKKDKLIVLTDDIYLKFANEDLLIDLAENKPLSDEKLEKISKIQKDKFPKTPGICLLVDFSIETEEREKIINKDEFSFRKLTIKTGEEIQKVGSFLLTKLKEGGKDSLKKLKKNGKPVLIKFGKLLQALAKDAKKVTKSVLKTIGNKASNGAKKLKRKLKNRKKTTDKKEKVKPESNKELINEKKDIDGNETDNQKIESEKYKTQEDTIKNRSDRWKKELDKLKSFISTEAEKALKNFKKITGKAIDKNYLPEKPHFSIPNNEIKRKTWFLMGLLVLIILTGSITAHSERSRQLEEKRARLSEIEEEIDNINIESDNAFNYLIAHYKNLSDLISRGTSYESRTKNLRNKASQKLLELSNTSIVEDPELLFSTNEIVPSKIEFINGEIYTYNPFLSNAEKYNPETGEQLVRPISFEDGSGIFSITSTPDYLLFFSRPNEIVRSNETQTSQELIAPYEDYSYQKLESFQNQLYFLERENNQVIRYHQNDLNNPEVWIEERVPGGINSFAVDGSIWMLKENNEIWSYENNRPAQDSLITHEEIFPLPERLSKIETSPGSPLFILESRNNRVIISSKEGDLLEQIIIPDARNIKDIAVHENKIYLLDSQEVYLLEVSF